MKQDFLQANSSKLNVNRRYSYPSKSGVKNSLAESAGAKELTILLKNPTNADAVVLISPCYDADTKNRTKYAAVADILSATSSTHALQTIAPNNDNSNFHVSCSDAGVTIENFLRSIYLNPTRIVGMSFDSRTIADGKQETTNYGKSLKTFYADPLEPQLVTEVKPIRPLLKDAFNIGLLQINFIKENLMALLSSENFFQFVVAKGTELSITFHIGAVHSSAQRMYRDLKESDTVIRQASMMG